MSFLGGKPPAAAVPTQLNSINVDQSTYGKPIPLVYGVQRLSINLGWYGAFTSTPVYSGGSGKGGRGPPSSFSYTASCVMLLCEGQITAIRQVWKDKDLTTLAAEGLTLFAGAAGQSPWPYLTSNFPSQAVPYDKTAYLAEANISLGGSAAIPNYTFETECFLSLPGTLISFTASLAAGATSATLTAAVLANGIWDITFSSNESRTCTVSGTAVTWNTTLPLVFAATSSAIAGGLDAEPSAILIDYCTDVNHGANFNALNPAIQGVGATTWQTYCIANGLTFSPLEDTQRPGTDFLKDMLEMTNSNGVMSAGSYNITPYGDSAISANGRTFTPNLTPLFSFGDDDLMPNNQGTNNDPVVMTQKELTQTYNVVRVEYLDRGNAYNVALAEWTDPLDQALNGIRVMPNKTFHQICDARVAYSVAALIGQRQLYIRNTYQFTVRADYCLLEPLDLIAVTDSLIIGGVETRLGLVNALLRIIETQDDENDIFTITAEEMFIGTATAPKYNFQAAQGYAANFASPPVSIGTPLVFTAPPALVSAAGGYELWVAAGPSTGGEYGGAYVYGSLDTITYSLLGTIAGQAKYGTTTASITASATSVTVALNAGATADGIQLSNASAADFAANRSLIWLDGEVIGFENVTLVSAGTYTLSPISRGLFGTGPSPGVGVTHASGASWARLDEAIFKFPIDPGMIGQTLDLKLPTFNSVSRAAQDLSTATAFPHLITASSGTALIAGPLKLIGRGVTVNGNNVFKSAATSAWDSDVYSVQGYTNGAFVSWQPVSASAQMGFGLNSDPTTDSSFTSIDYWMDCGGGGAGILTIFNSGTAIFTFGGTFAAGDVLAITYDGAFVRYLQNGVVFFQQPAAANQTLYLDSSFHDPQATAANLQFGPYGTAIPVLWIARGGATVSDEAITKASGAAGVYDCDAYSISGYKQAHMLFKGKNGGTEICGFVANPTAFPPASIARANVTHGIELIFPSSAQVVESGTVIAGPFSYANTDFFSVTYDGTNVIYGQNTTTLHTTALSGATMFGMVAIAATFAIVNSVEFGPGAVIPVTDTGQIGANAASQIVSNFSAANVATNNNVTQGTGSSTDANVITAAVTTTGNPMAIDVGCTVTLTGGGAPGSSFVSGVLDVFMDGASIGSAKWDGTNLANFGGGSAPPAIQVTLSATNTPSPGAHTYALHAHVAGTGSAWSCTINCINNFIKVREIKR